MKNILEEIAARTRERIAKEKSRISVSELENRIQEVNKNAGQKITFLQALQKDGMSYICEVKKASPSKGLIAPDFPYLAIAKEITSNKAIADKLYLSIHTVITHRRNIARKLQIHSPAGLTIYAIVNKLVELSDIKDTL